MTPRLLLAILGALGLALVLWLLRDPPPPQVGRGARPDRPSGAEAPPGRPPDAPAPPSAPAAEAPGAPPSPAPPPSEPAASVPPVFPWVGPITWHDADGPHLAYASARLLVAFRQPPGPDGRPLPPVPGARLLGSRPGVTIWELPEGVGAPEALARARAQGGAWSPAFQEREGVGRVLAAPGGVFLRLDPSWDAERARAWAEEAGVPAPRALAIGPGWHMVATPPGEAALEVAERLRALPGVVEAFPDWWRDYAPR